jgi:hypothetical protein
MRRIDPCGTCNSMIRSGAVLGATILVVFSILRLVERSSSGRAAATAVMDSGLRLVQRIRDVRSRRTNGRENSAQESQRASQRDGDHDQRRRDAQ